MKNDLFERSMLGLCRYPSAGSSKATWEKLVCHFSRESVKTRMSRSDVLWGGIAVFGYDLPGWLELE